MPTESSSLPGARLTAMTTLAPALRVWEIYLRDQGRSNYTIKAFLGDMQLLAGFLPPDRSLGAITTKDLNNFLQWLQGGPGVPNSRGVPCSAKSLARRVTSVKAFFRWLNRGGVLLADPAEKVVQQSVISPLAQVLTAAEQADVLEAAEEYRHKSRPDARPYALLSLLLATGIKKGECLAINLNHIDLEAPNGPILFVRYGSLRNRYKERKIALPEDWVKVYREYLAQYHPGEQLFPWSPRRLEYLLEDLGEEGGLEKKHLSFDMCRWTCALNDLRAGVETEKIRQKLGISKIQWREIGMKLRRLAEGEK
jgi:site-specific recombinase XerD